MRAVVSVTAACLGLAAIMSVAPAAGAPDDSSSSDKPRQAMQLEEIVVTATRRTENIQDVPISITAFTQDQMDVQGMRDVDDIARLTPGVQFNRVNGFGSGLGSLISIRGISSQAGGSTTGIYIDDTPIQARATLASGNFSANAYPRLFDVERVEVLRGPQGTLFGSGAEGGAIRFITPAPNLVNYSSYVRSEVSYTQYGAPSYESGVAGGGPIVDGKLGFRASVWTRHDGGYIDHANWYTQQIVDSNANRSDTFSTRVAFGWAPVENLVITPSVFYQHVKVNDTGAFFLPSEDPATFQQPLGNVAAHDYVNGYAVRQWGDQRLTLPALKVDWSFAKMELISNTSYYDREEDAQTDYSFLDFGNWTSIFSGGKNIILYPSPQWTAPGEAPQKNRYLTQEVRLQSTDNDSRLKWVAGAFYSKNTLMTKLAVDDPWLGSVFKPVADFFTGGNCNPQPLGPPANDCVAQILGSPLYQGKYPYYGVTTVHETQKSVFGQVDYSITKNLIATVGARWSDLHFDFTNAVAGPVNGGEHVDAGTSNNTAFTPKYMLSWKTDGGALFYASAAKGFRNGGANASVVNPTCQSDLERIGLTKAPLTYDPDSVWSYELGSKFTTDHGRVMVDASVYKINWNNIITNQSLACILSFTTNLGTATSQGADFAVQWRALDSLTLSMSAAYADVHFTSTIPTRDIHGNQLYDAEGRPLYWTQDGDSLPGSNTSVNLAAQYGFRLVELPSYARVDFSWQSADRKGNSWNPSSADYQGPDPKTGTLTNLFAQPADHQVNLRIGSNINKWDISMFVNNLTNYQPIFVGFPARVVSNAPLITASTLRPRTIGLTAVYRY